MTRAFRILRGTARGGGGGRVASEHAHMSGDGIRTDQQLSRIGLPRSD